jgi:three-Cys-motif partner protein
MSLLKARPTQTKIKHLILEEYLRAWTYIIFSGLRGRYERQRSRGQSFASRFVYVDCFANSGQYAAERGNPVYGSPIIGIRAIDHLRQHWLENVGYEPQTSVLLIEQDTTTYEALLQNLEAVNYGSRIKKMDSFQAPRNHQIAVIRGDWRTHLDDLLRFTGEEYTWSFYFIDPFGQSPIPLDAVARVVSAEHHDAIINLPYQDLHKKTGSAGKPDPTPAHVKHMAYYDAMYGNTEWRQIAIARYEGSISGKEMEQELAELYFRVLQEQDPTAGIKRIPLKFQDKERTMFYLFLTTHDGTGALKMNEILDDAQVHEFDLREERRSERKGGQMSLFAPEEIPGRPTLSDFDIEGIAEDIYQLCRGEMLTFGEVWRRLANLPYYYDDVKSAMTKLKRTGRATYESNFSNKDTVTFR